MIQPLPRSRLLYDAKLESGFAVDLTTPSFPPSVVALTIQFPEAEVVKGLTATGLFYFDSGSVFVEQRSERRAAAQRALLFDETALGLAAIARDPGRGQHRKKKYRTWS